MEIGICFTAVGLLAFFTAVLIIHLAVKGTEWAAWSALLSSGIVASLALGSIIFYFQNTDSAIPYMSSIAACSSAGLFVLLEIEYTVVGDFPLLTNSKILFTISLYFFVSNIRKCAYLLSFSAFYFRLKVEIIKFEYV